MRLKPMTGADDSDPRLKCNYDLQFSVALWHGIDTTFEIRRRTVGSARRMPVNCRNKMRRSVADML